MCDLLVPLVTRLDICRVGLDHDAFSDHLFDGLPRNVKDVEKPIKDVREGKSYLSLIMLNPVFQILKIDQPRTCYCMSFGKVKLLSSVSYTPCWLSHPLTLLNLNPCSTQDSSSLALLMVNVLALCLGFSAMLLNKLFQKGISCYLNFCNSFENCVACVSFGFVIRCMGFFSKQNV